jgi:hypothetical protein
MKLRNKIISYLFLSSAFIFLIFPLTAPLNIKHPIYKEFQYQFRTLTGSGFRFMMFAPTISEIKSNTKFIFYNAKDKQEEVLDWRQLVPFIYRIHIQQLFNFESSYISDAKRDISKIDKFLEIQLSKRGYSKVKVVINKYIFNKLSQDDLRVREVVWEYEYARKN